MPRRRRRRTAGTGERTTALLAACELAAGPFAPEERKCDWCGDQLHGPQRRWCSPKCAEFFVRNRLMKRFRGG